MPGVSKTQVEQAKKTDLLSYLQSREPGAIRKSGPGEYCLLEHDSLKISNGKWHWFSRGIGGKTALDFLIHVRGMAFTEAVRHLCDERSPPAFSFQQVKAISKPAPQKQIVFTLPARNPDNTRVIAYLQSRGIDREVIEACIQAGILHESAKTHSCVFVGRDSEGTARFACQRGTMGNFKQDVEGSDKRYGFSTAATATADLRTTVPLYVFESAIDALSFATIRLRHDEKSWDNCHYLALSGTSPLALEQYLRDYPDIKSIRLCLDNDPAGRKATETITTALEKRGFRVTDLPPPSGKDWNEALQIVKKPPGRQQAAISL